MDISPNVSTKLARSVAEVVGTDVRAVGVFAPEGTHAQRLPRRVVLALGTDAVHVLRKPAFGSPEAIATWPLTDLSATVTPNKLTVELDVRLRSGAHYRLETPAGGLDAGDVAYRIAGAGRPSLRE